ncbi:MAG: glycosyltransferase family 2 protein [Bradyrhizobium sp.]
MQVAVMILNYNGGRWLPPLYEALRQQTDRTLRVYLVDNGSSDDSVPLTRTGYPEVTVLRMPGNLGYSMAYNAAMPHAFAEGCDWVIWANNDIRLEPDCIAELIRVASEPGAPVILGPAFMAWDSDEPNAHMQARHPHAVGPMQRRQPTPIEVEWVEGSLLMVSRSCVEDVGPLDPCFFFYWEEADFCRRARYRGWKVALVPSAIARHYTGGSTEAHRDDSFQRLRVRNKYIYTFTDPFHGWARNCVGVLHLFLARIKAGLHRSDIQLWTEFQVFAGTLLEWRVIRRKLLRDRAGDRPPSFQRVPIPVNVEVIKAARVGA